MRSKQYRHRQRTKAAIVPDAGPLKIIRLDGSVEIRPSLTPQQAKRIIGRQRGRHHQ